MENFWQKLPRPFFVLAPMEDVTDTVFRQMVAHYGRPDVFFTEFTNVDGIVSEQGRAKVTQRFKFGESERPIVAQIWGREPEKFRQAAKIVAGLGFDGIDINMACPARPVLKIGCGGALIGQNSQVAEIVAAVKEGAGNLPVSIKTRLGYKGINSDDWIGFLLTLGLAELTIHGRTVAEKSEVPAHWDEIGMAVTLRNLQFRRENKSEGLRDSSTRSDELGRNDNKGTLIVGNGDVKSLEEAAEKVQQYGVDGVMIGRGIFENVAVFDKSGRQLSPSEKLRALSAHAKLYEQTWGKTKDFQVIKKFVKAYVNGFEGASAMRMKLMEAENEGELQELLTIGDLK